MSYLLLHYLDIYIYEMLVKAKASEQSARMVSMKMLQTMPTNLSRT